MARASKVVVAGALVAALVAGPLDLQGSDPPALPGPAPRARPAGFDPAAQSSRCETCHVEIGREWRASLHKRAWEDPVFGAAYALEPLAFCRGCHAPEADPAEKPGAPARSIGVGCVTCHVRDGEVVGSRARPATKDAHAVVADARFSTAQACARCHQFDFPSRPGAPMQDTVGEHKHSKYSNTACQGCHMPAVAGEDGKSHRSHAFRVLGDAAMLRSAVAASAVRSTAQAITVTLRAGRVGHAFPTGDMFRRLEVRAYVLDAEGAALGRAAPVVLERRFAVTPGKQGTGRMQTGDTRVDASGAPREVLLIFGEDVEGRSVRWEVAYQRMSPAMAATFGVDPSKDEVIVASGTLLSAAGVTGRR